MILRGGGGKTNFDAESVASATAAMHKVGVDPSLVIDCSHGNSSKKPENQPLVASDVTKQVAAGDKSIKGLMIESHINAGTVIVVVYLRFLGVGGGGGAGGGGVLCSQLILAVLSQHACKP
jgi:3-deoxy-7-phosphoheptulonate synthase